MYRWDELEEHFIPQTRELMQMEEEYLLDAVRNKNWDVLEIGCGTGRLLTKLAPCVRRIEGVDHEYSQIEIARQRTRGLQNVKVRYGDGRALPEFLSSEFDLSFSVLNTLGNQGYDKFAFLKGVRATAKPEGTIIFSVYAENALDYQVEQYTRFGCVDIRNIDDFVFARNLEGKSWTSERFSKDKLARLFHDTGFTSFNIDNLTDFSYVVNARK